MGKLFKSSLLGISLSATTFALGNWCDHCGECDHNTESCPHAEPMCPHCMTKAHPAMDCPMPDPAMM